MCLSVLNDPQGIKKRLPNGGQIKLIIGCFLKRLQYNFSQKKSKRFTMQKVPNYVTFRDQNPNIRDRRTVTAAMVSALLELC